MGLIRFLSNLFTGNRNVIVETAEVFRENADKGAQRSAEYGMAVQQQFAQEFLAPKRSSFDTFIDGLNRLPRPALAFGVIFLFVAAMTNPTWFAARMSGVALIPEPLWWLMGVVVSFYFGARYQTKGQEFRRQMQAELQTMPQRVQETLSVVQEIEDSNYDPTISLNAEEPPEAGANAAISEWRQGVEK